MSTDRFTEFKETLHFGWKRRLPILLQTEAAECGLACLAMVARYYGYDTDLPALRRKFSLSLKGATLARLAEMSEQLHLQARPLRLELDEIRQLRTPCILHWNLNHFVVLRGMRGKAVWLHDPAVGERVLPLEEVSRQFSGVALELTPASTFRRTTERQPLAWRALTGRILGLKRALVQIFLFALVLEVFALVSPWFMQIVLDQVLADGDQNLLAVVGVGFILLMVAQVAVGAMRSWAVLSLGTRLNLTWTTNVFGHLLRLPEAYFGKRHLGDIVSRFGAVGAIQHTLTTRVVEVILDGLMTVLTLGMMLFYSTWLTGLTLAAFLLYIGVRATSYQVFREASSGEIVAAAKQQSLFLESLRGNQAIRLNNGITARTGKYVNCATDALNRTVITQRFGLIFGTLNKLIFGAERIGMLWLGAYLALHGKLSAGMLVAFAAYSDQFTGRAASLVDYVVDLKMLSLQGERLADIVLEAPERNVESDYLGPEPAPGITVRDLGFRYAKGEEWVLRHLDFTIRSGESVAIVGASGCGKSTLAKLLLGLLDPEEGEILIGGIPLQRLGKSAYRRMLGTVMQDDQLFAGSIADNIALFDPVAPQIRIEAAARLAGIHDEIVTMPMGYHSLVGDMGSTLSGGQKQRVLLARALYRKPRILVLDEATSHLDVGCERKVNAAIARMKLTRIVIAHRPETIASADRVMDLNAMGEEQNPVPKLFGVGKPEAETGNIFGGSKRK